MLTRTVVTMAVLMASLLAGSAAQARPPEAMPPGPPMLTGGQDTQVLHCQAFGEGFGVGVIVVNPNGEYAGCRPR